MKRWLLRLVKLGLLGCVLLGAIVLGGRWVANKDVEAVTQQEMQQRYERVVQWVRTNEGYVLQDGNVALWWMLRAAAHRASDAYLLALVDKAFALHYPPGRADVWTRLLDPKAENLAPVPDLDSLVPYQRFFHHALTCRPVNLPVGDTSVYLQQNMCSPIFSKVLVADPVCTTHQLMALDAYRQTGCPATPSLGVLEAELLDDIEVQLTWDPVMRDPHYQRVLALAWHGRADHIKPAWLRRMLDAQEADGSWRGYRRIPELPSWSQPWHWREWLAHRWPDVIVPDIQERDFHSTTQALLVLALLRDPDTAVTMSDKPVR
jgi:hypothetical protein